MRYELRLCSTTLEFDADNVELYFEGSEGEYLYINIIKGKETLTILLEPDVGVYEIHNGKPHFLTSDEKLWQDMNDPVYGHINDDQMDELRLMGKLP